MGIRKKRVVPIQQAAPAQVSGGQHEVVNMGAMIQEAQAQPQQQSGVDQFFGNPVVQQIIFALGQKLAAGVQPAKSQQPPAPKTKEDLLRELEGRTGII